MDSQRLRPRSLPLTLALAGSLLTLVPLHASAQDQTRVVVWNDLGMHCLDPDFSVFTLLPPYNTFHAQLIVNGELQDLPGPYTLTYSAATDPNGSINRSSIGKTNFWQHVQELFGVALAPDMGLAGYGMPGPANAPQTMGFDAAWRWFDAIGVPITPYDDAGNENPYPLMAVTARNAAGQAVATTTAVLPNSEEMTCTECHASFTNPFARPDAGWVRNPDPQRDHRLNILRLHDERNAGNPAYADALAAAGYAPTGLYDTVRVDHVAVLCDRCHFSNALGIGMPGITPMTAAIHAGHATARDPYGETLESATRRSGCYACHPGPETKCLRGAMGKAIGPDGDHSMECQSCHGSMSAVGASTRNGWFDEPSCQSCHTGSATHNNGELRYTSVFEPDGTPRHAVSDLFATDPDTPLPGASLYRFSSGHGGLQCSACHGPPHAIYPTSEANDNLQSIALQGHEGTLIECTTCHASLEDDQVAGPHGMHPLGAKWVNDLHGDLANTSLAPCLECHNGDARGSVLSRAQGERKYATPFGAKQFWRGYQISCYACHNGPSNTNPTTNTPPVVSDRAVATPSDVPALLTLTGSDANGDALTFRVVAQPAHGTVGLIGAEATYRADAGFVGTETFTYAAWDGKANSNLGTVTVTVGAPQCAGGSEAFGFGTIGSGDFLPRLELVGCATPGGSGALVLSDALGGSTATLLGGFGRRAAEFYPGSVLRVGTIAFRLAAIPVTGSGAGQGGFVLPFTIPPTFPVSDVVFQAFVHDPAAGFQFAGTNGLEVHVR